jgi:hypothetical protein
MRRNSRLKSRILLPQTKNGIGIDISISALDFERNAVRRASVYNILPGIELRICSAEDLMVMKLFASRAIDLRDAEGIAARNGKTLDWRYVEAQLTPLAEIKEEPEMLDRMMRLKRLRV